MFRGKYFVVASLTGYDQAFADTFIINSERVEIDEGFHLL